MRVCTSYAIMRSNSGFRRQRQRRSVTENTLRLTTLMSDLRCRRKDLTAFLHGVGHAFGKSELAEDVADGTSESDGEDVNQQVPSRNADHTGNVQVGYLRFYRAKPNAWRGSGKPCPATLWHHSQWPRPTPNLYFKVTHSLAAVKIFFTTNSAKCSCVTELRAISLRRLSFLLIIVRMNEWMNDVFINVW